MRDCDCIDLLRWALPRLRMQWRGFRKVRGQVCKRIQRRMRALSIPDIARYRAYLEQHADEWLQLRDLCRITISRFCRDKGEYLCLETEVLPALARRAIQRGDVVLKVWSAGCACGEEPYSLALLWELTLRERFPTLGLQVIATDIDDAVLARAELACYRHGSLKDLPPTWRTIGFERTDSTYCLRQRFKRPVRFRHHDVCGPPPGTGFDLILCRNLVFTYFDESLQHTFVDRVLNALAPGGALMLGSHEQLPTDERRLTAWPTARCVFTARKRPHVSVGLKTNF